MSDKKIRVAVGGQGRSGYGIHCDHLRTDTERFDIVAAADQQPERREDATVEFGAKVYDDWRPMLEEGGFDLFINALPSPLHVDASIEALNRGFHVVSEKPMARTVADFDRVAVHRGGRVVAVSAGHRGVVTSRAAQTAELVDDPVAVVVGV